MRAPAVGLLLASSLALGIGSLPAHAQFGLPTAVPGVRNLTGPGPGPLVRLPPGVASRFTFSRQRQAFGIIGVIAVGSGILSSLSRRDAIEVARRSRIILDRDLEQEVVEEYDTRDRSRRVVITASPSRKASEIRDDPALKQTSEIMQHAGGSSGASGKKGAKQEADKKDADVVKVDDLAPDAPCRKVTTRMHRKGAKPKDDAAGDGGTSNTSVLCQTPGGEWKPAAG